MSKHQFNVEDGEGVAHFIPFIYCWKACEFPPRDQQSVT